MSEFSLVFSCAKVNLREVWPLHKSPARRGGASTQGDTAGGPPQRENANGPQRGPFPLPPVLPLHDKKRTARPGMKGGGSFGTVSFWEKHRPPAAPESKKAVRPMPAARRSR